MLLLNIFFKTTAKPNILNILSPYYTHYTIYNDLPPKGRTSAYEIASNFPHTIVGLEQNLYVWLFQIRRYCWA